MMYSKFSIGIEYNVKLNMKSKPSEKPYLRKCAKIKKKECDVLHQLDLFWILCNDRNEHFKVSSKEQYTYTP